MSFLPGMFPASATVPFRLQEINLVAQNLNQSSPSFPAGIQNGDILIFTQWSANLSGSPPGLVTPSGFTSLRSNTIGLVRTNVAYKLADGTESGAFSGMAGTSANLSNILVFRPDKRVTGIAVMSNVTSGGLNGDPGAITILSGGSTGPKFVVATYTSSGTVDPRVFTQGGVDAKQGEVTPSSPAHQIAWKTFQGNEATSDVVVDMTDEGDNNEINGIAFTLTT